MLKQFNDANRQTGLKPNPGQSPGQDPSQNPNQGPKALQPNEYRNV